MMHLPIPLDKVSPDQLDRAKHEIDETFAEQSGRLWTRVAFGVLFANALVLLKDFIYGDGKAAASKLTLGRASPFEASDASEDLARNATEVEQDIGEINGHQDGGRFLPTDAPAAIVKPSKGATAYLKGDSLMIFPADAPPVPERAGRLSIVQQSTTADQPVPVDEIATHHFEGGKSDSTKHRETKGAGGAIDPQVAGGSQLEAASPRGSDRTTNRPPSLSGPVILTPSPANLSVVIGLDNLLRTANDPDGDTLSVTALRSSSGTITRVNANTWEFTPQLNDTSDVTLSYKVSDGNWSVDQLALLDLLPVAGDGDGEQPGNNPDLTDANVGTAAVIEGGASNDNLTGTAGNDVLAGGDGDDTLEGRAGDDLMYGSGGNDTMRGGAGNDVMYGGAGNDVMQGDDGNDVIFGDAGNDILSGGAGADVMLGGEGDDRLAGDGDNDTLVGEGGKDTLIGGMGDDLIVATAYDDNDVIDGGSGSDTYSLVGTTADAIVDLASGSAVSAETGVDVISGVENVVGSNGNDRIIGDAATNRLTGGQGDDILAGGDGDDTFVATVGDGNDEIAGGSGVDTYDLSSIDADAIIDLAMGTAHSAATGDDTLSSIENVIGSIGNDKIIASEVVNILAGGEGEDVFVFHTTLAAGNGSGKRDLILDFEVGDRIDLDKISREFADHFETTLSENGIRKFVLIDEAQTFSRPGELRIKYEFIDDREVTIVEGNIDFDEATDFQIELVGSKIAELSQLWDHA